MSQTHPYDQPRTVISVADARLTRVLLREPERCASVDEYSKATGIEPNRVMELLGPFIDNATLSYEFVGDDIFVHTAPRGRPAPPATADVAPNLWEVLRSSAGPELAWSLWKLMRALEVSGWKVETHPNAILFSMSKILVHTPQLGVYFHNQVVPLAIFPSADEVSSPTGVLSEYERAGAWATGIVCAERALEDMVTASRQWILDRPSPPGMGVLVLEAPRYQPTMLSAYDASIIPIEVAKAGNGPVVW